MRAYTFCLLEQLKTTLYRRDIFSKPSWRYADPRANLLAGAEWEAMRPIVCRTLELPSEPKAILDALTIQLDQAYRDVAQRLPANPFIRFETVGDKEELILTPLDQLEEPPSLIQLRKRVNAMLPRIDLPDLVLEIVARTDFAEAFTHLTENTARATDLTISLCAALLAEACNTGTEPFIRSDTPALRRDRLAWVKQNYLRDDTITAGNAKLVAAQNKIALAHAWGGGEVASADGMRFVVPIRTVHAGPNPKYFGPMKGITWYNLLSNQFTGLNAIPVPGTLRDSLVLLSQASAGFQSLTEAVDTTSSAGHMMMQMVGAFAEFERAMLRERTKHGLDAARKDGRIGGRRPKLKAPQELEIVHLVRTGQKTAADAARLFNVHPATVSRLLARTRQMQA